MPRRNHICDVLSAAKQTVELILGGNQPSRHGLTEILTRSWSVGGPTCSPKGLSPSTMRSVVNLGIM